MERTQKYWMKLILPFILLAVMALTNCSKSKNEQIVSLRFRATDQANLPLPQVKIKLKDTILETDSNGILDFSLTVKKLNTKLAVSAQKTGYEYLGPGQIELRNLQNEYQLPFRELSGELKIIAQWKSPKEQINFLKNVRIFVNKKPRGTTGLTGELRTRLKLKDRPDTVSVTGKLRNFRLVAGPEDSMLVVSRQKLHYYVYLNFEKAQAVRRKFYGALVKITSIPRNARIILKSETVIISGTTPFTKRVRRDLYSLSIMPNNENKYEPYKSPELIDLTKARTFIRSYELKPKLSWSQLADSALAQNQFDDALEYLKRIPKPEKKSEADNYVKARFTMGQIEFNEVKNYLNAIDDFQEALKYKPGNTNIYFNLALSYVKTKQYQLALQSFDEIFATAYNILPQNYDKLMSEIRFFRGVSYEGLYQNDGNQNLKFKAFRAFQEYLDNFPEELKNGNLDRRQVVANKMNLLKQE